MFTPIVSPYVSAGSPRRPTCINLRERFGKRFKVRFEESYYAERLEFRAAEAPWLMLIPCVGGEIYPHGGTTLAVFIRRGARVKRLAAIPGVQVKTDGDDGATFHFDVADFDKVAEIVKPRRRRTATDKVRAHLAEVGAKTRFGHGVESRREGQESTIGARPDILAVPTGLEQSASVELVSEVGG